MLACYNATMQLIPAIDLLGDDAVRLEQGDYDRVLFRQPLEDFVRRVVATGPELIHVVDLQGARDGAVRLDVVARCVGAASGVALQISGGIRSLESAREVIDAGATRVIVGTSLWRDDESLASFAAALGEQLVAALDIRDGRLAVRGWLADSGISLEDALARCRDAGVARVHVTAIERDGTMSGPDFALYERACASGIPVVAAGGVRDQDIARLDALGCEAAVMGVGYLARLGLDDLIG
jgi:phosphoribosylformimino-5-aminoimidazole carboxamide ribotide isomerase